MGRPHKILEDTKTYSLLMTIRQYEILSAHSDTMTKSGMEKVAVADLIREAIEIYIEALEDEEYEGEAPQDDKTVQGS
jgi:predicted DNA-binding protein